MQLVVADVRHRNFVWAQQIASILQRHSRLHKSPARQIAHLIFGIDWRLVFTKNQTVKGSEREVYFNSALMILKPTMTAIQISHPIPPPLPLCE